VPDETNPWTTLSTRRHHEDRYAGYDEDWVRHRSGREHTHAAIRFKVFGLVVAPIDAEGRVTLVGQYRYVLGRYTWELPGGSGPVGVDPLATAQRELSEETGIDAAHWLEILRVAPMAGIASEVVPAFVAWGLKGGQAHPDPTEALTRRQVPFTEAVGAVISGEIIDAPSCALLLTLSERARRGDLPAGLAALIG
jgi:8-oxo-dGTP pyrophosphatase MutT (NUDIX family)